MDAKLLVWCLRDEGETVICDRCGKELQYEEAIPEEGGEWECYPCNKRCNEQERIDALPREGDAR